MHSHGVCEPYRGVSCRSAQHPWAAGSEHGSPAYAGQGLFARCAGLVQLCRRVLGH